MSAFFSKAIATRFLYGGLVFILIVSSFFGGTIYQKQRYIASAQAAAASVKGFGETLSAPKVVDFAQFWKVWDYIRHQYVDQPVSDQDLYYGALQGLVYGLKDPYSVYFTPSEAAAFADQLDGSFSGIGAEIGIDKDGFLAVVAPIKDSPAAKAGLLAGDRIAAIDNLDTAGMTVNEAVRHIRGEKGTPVVLIVVRQGVVDPISISIVRDDITIDSVAWAVREDDIGVISISTFDENTSELFAKAAADMVAANVRGIILDLRNNPGGYLESALNLAGYWVNGQTGVIEEVRGARQEYPADGSNALANVKTVILVNGGSASASEILAGALQDYGKAVLVGTQTFGKGSVQGYQEFPDGSSMKITVARWLTPKGRSIDKVGITPDNIVELTKENTHDTNKDPQFDEAVSLFSTP
jgi:carboxyl-terminal processing protease